jgi:hypothetical protein
VFWGIDFLHHLVSEGRLSVVTQKQVEAPRRTAKRAQAGARQERLIADMPASTRAAVGRQK